MGNVLETERRALRNLKEKFGTEFPGSDYHPPDRKNWMAGLNPEKIHLNKIVWPGTHNSATNGIGIPWITQPFGECQSLSVYEQLVIGTRALDIRVQEDLRVCHGILVSYHVDVVIKDVMKFLSETKSEIIILEIRTEFGHKDPPNFDKYLEEKLGKFLINQNDQVFDKKVSDLLPKRVICVWKPRNSFQPIAGSPLWSTHHLKDDWIDTSLPFKKFESNMKHLSEQPSVGSRKFFYKVENTVTPKADNLITVTRASERIGDCARLFVNQCFGRGHDDRLQIFSTDFVDEDFVDACIGFTYARVQGKAWIQ